MVSVLIDKRLSSGTYTASVRIDTSNSIFCPFPSGTRQLSSALNIERSLPTWSMKSYSISAEQIISDDKVHVINRLTVVYNVSIALTTPLVELLFWSDAYFLSDRSTFDQRVAKRLAETSHRITVDESSSGVLEHTVEVHKTIEIVDPPVENSIQSTPLYGNLYFYTFVDESNINEKVSMFNFPEMRRVTLSKIISTLNITEFEVENQSNYTTSSKGYLVPLRFAVKNLGPLTLSFRPTFSIYLSWSQSQIKLDQTQLDTFLKVNEEEKKSLIVEIPNTYFGELKLSIKSNDLTALKVLTTQAQSISIEQPSSADLAAAELVFTTSLEPYKNTTNDCDLNLLVLKVTYTVENVGVSMTETGVWNDQVDIVCKSSNKLGSRSVRSARQLRYKQSYSNSLQWIFDSAVFGQNAQNCQVVLIVNSDGRLFEFDKQNNRKSECCFDVPKKAEAVLESEIREPTTSISINSTGFLNVRYVFRNLGNGSSPFVSTWTDDFYLANQSSITFGITQSSLFFIIRIYVIPGINVKNRTS